MRIRTIVLGFTITALAVVGAAFAGGAFHEVHPGEFDPGHTRLVNAAWLEGAGCPTGAITFDGTTATSYTDPACPTGDPRDSNKGKDQHNEGLVLVKTGPTPNDAAAGAKLKDVPSTLTELGYDIRKPASAPDSRGSACGAGAPRFDVFATDGSYYFIGCNSPPPTTQQVGNGWIRLRWGGGSTPLMAYTTSGTLVSLATVSVKSIEIVFDEGQDTTDANNFGLAVLDNIDVNGTLVGQGPDDAGAK